MRRARASAPWRRNPDRAWLQSWPERDLAELVIKQAAILDQASRLVRKGGRLVYATCSLLSEENEAQVQAFPFRPPGFLRCPAARAGLDVVVRAAGRRRVPVADAAPPRHRRVLRRGAGAAGVIAVRRARPADAAQIAQVHVAAWRSAYPGILPEAFLARLSIPRQAAHYHGAIRAGVGVYVATASGPDLGPAGGAARIVGFVTGGPARARRRRRRHGGEGEVETLYVLDDWRDRGLGRRLMRAAAAHLAGAGCRSAFVWVLRDNPSRWFYERLGGKVVAESIIHVGGASVVQTAYAWAPIEKLAQATSSAP